MFTQVFYHSSLMILSASLLGTRLVDLKFLDLPLVAFFVKSGTCAALWPAGVEAGDFFKQKWHVCVSRSATSISDAPRMPGFCIWPLCLGAPSFLVGARPQLLLPRSPAVCLLSIFKHKRNRPWVLVLSASSLRLSLLETIMQANSICP